MYKGVTLLICLFALTTGATNNNDGDENAGSSWNLGKLLYGSLNGRMYQIINEHLAKMSGIDANNIEQNMDELERWFNDEFNKKLSLLNRPLRAALKQLLELRTISNPDKRQITSNKIEPNMEELERMLGSVPKRKVSLGNGPLRVVLQQLLELRSISSPDERCNWKSYRILVLNNRGVSNRVHLLRHEPLENIRRIDQIIKHFTLDHARNCLPVYLKLFQSKYAQLWANNQEFVRRAELVVDALTPWKARLDEKDQVHYRLNDLAFILHMKRVRSKNEAKRVLKALKTLTEHDPDREYLGKVYNEIDGKTKVRKAKVKQLYWEYVLEPCKYYVSEIGPDLYLFLEFDDRTFVGNDYKLYSENKEIVRFYHAMGVFRLCQLIVNQFPKPIYYRCLFGELVKLIRETQ